MEDQSILDLYFQRSEQAIVETDRKYGGYCYSVAYNILSNREDSEESVSDQGRYYGFYRCGANGPEFIEKVVRDPITLYWGYAQAGQNGKNVREEKAMAVIASYQRLSLERKPFTEYPMQ